MSELRGYTTTKTTTSSNTIQQAGRDTHSAAADSADLLAKQPTHAAAAAYTETASVRVSQPTLTATHTTRTTKQHLATFKGPILPQPQQQQQQAKANGSSNNNSGSFATKNNNNSSGNRPPAARHSLESINSSYSTSSATDDSQLHHLTTTGGCKAADDSATQVGSLPPLAQHNARHSACGASLRCPPGAAAAAAAAKPAESLYVSPPSLPAATGQSEVWARQTVDLMKTNEKAPAAEQQLVSMISLGADKDKQQQILSARRLTARKSPPISDRAPQEDDRDGVRIVGPASSKQPEGGSRPPFKFAGILASLAASVCFSLSFFCVKLLPNESYPARAQALFFRGVYITLFCAIAIIVRRETFLVKRDEIWVNLLRAIFGSVGVFGTLCALKYISLGDSTALVFSSPIWTSILSRFILKEPIHAFNLVALPLSIFGIILIAHPALIISDEHLSIMQHSPIIHLHPAAATSVDLQLMPNATNNVAPAAAGPITDVELLMSDVPLEPSDERWIGICISLCTSLVVSGTYIVLKFRKSTPVQTTTFWLGVCLIAFSIVIMSIIGFGELPTNYELLLYLCNGTLSWMGQIVLQWAFLHEAAGVLAIVRTMDVALTFILSALFLDDDIYWTSILGASIISLVVVAIMMNNWISEWVCMRRRLGAPPSDVESRAQGEPHIEEERHSKEKLSCKSSNCYSIKSTDTTVSRRQPTYRQAKA